MNSTVEHEIFLHIVPNILTLFDTLVLLGTLNTSAGNNISNVSAVSKTPPSAIKIAVKDPKLFQPGKMMLEKMIDPVWLAQSKLEAANIANANKLLVISSHVCARITLITTNSNSNSPNSFFYTESIQQFWPGGRLFSRPVAAGAIFARAIHEEARG